MEAAYFTGMPPQLVHQVYMWRVYQFVFVYCVNMYTCIISPIILKVWKIYTEIIVYIDMKDKYKNTSFYYSRQGGGGGGRVLASAD